jgi:hypothetical protein
MKGRFMNLNFSSARVGRAFLRASLLGALLATVDLPPVAQAQNSQPPLLPAVSVNASTFAQDGSTLPSAPSAVASDADVSARLGASSAIGTAAEPHSPVTSQGFIVRDKFGYYLTETYFNPSVFTAPAFRAGLRMANPPGHGATRYAAEWRQGAAAFGRNYGDAFAERVTFQSARFATGILTREDPRYIPSASRNLFARSFHALSFSFVDQSDSGHRMPALSNFVGVTAAGFVGNAYLPAGFDNATHAGQRATLRFVTFAAGNLFREFAPQMPKPMRTFFQLIAR